MPPLARYQPNDAQITVAALDYLHNTAPGLGLRHAIAALPHPGNPTVAQIAALRREFPLEPTHAALTLAKLQPKARAKFPHLPYLWATPEALEQATHTYVARHKAARFALGRPTRIFDLCAGIGGDALALAHIAPVTAVDLSPVRTTCLCFNALDAPPPHPLEIQTRDIHDFLAELPPDTSVHIDPARRAAGKRSPHYADLIPGPDFLERLLTRARAVMVKLSPAVDFDSLPPAHIEIISHDRTVVQALLLVGFDLPPAQRTATILTGDGPGWSLTASPRPAVVPPMPAEVFAPTPETPVHLYEVDGAITRAGLAQHLAEAHHLLPLTIDGGYLLSAPGATPLFLPPLTPFRVHTIVPISRVSTTLRHLPPNVPRGPVEVKARGHLPGIDTDPLQCTWSKTCPYAYTALLFRMVRETYAAIASRSLYLPDTR
jgi:hypothetical protein